MRMFVALVPPPGRGGPPRRVPRPRREAAAFRWATPEQFHVTLASSPRCRTAGSTTWSSGWGGRRKRRTPFPTRIAGGGAFPNAGRARVLWAGLDLDDDGRTELDRMATGARAAASKAGIAVDGRRFRPHITLARLGRPTEVSRWVQLLDGYAGPPWSADRVDLVASYLGEGPRGRPRYETVETFPLG